MYVRHAVARDRDLEVADVCVERAVEDALLGDLADQHDAVDALPVEDVLEAMEAATAYEATSLDAPRPGDDEDDGWSWGDSVSVEEHGYELVEIGD